MTIAEKKILPQYYDEVVKGMAMERGVNYCWNGMVDHNECAIDGSYLGYLEIMSYLCRHWTRDRKWRERTNGTI